MGERNSGLSLSYNRKCLNKDLYSRITTNYLKVSCKLINIENYFGITFPVNMKGGMGVKSSLAGSPAWRQVCRHIGNVGLNSYFGTRNHARGSVQVRMCACAH